MRRLLQLLCIVLMLGLGMATPVVVATGAVAQQPMQGPDYEGWEAVATRVEDALESGEVSTPILEDLRRIAVDFRQQFIDAQGTNSATIRTVRDQLDTLGPVPEDGSEPPDVAVQREELNRRLARLEAPVRTAELAQRRADGLITAIDEMINARQTEELLRLGPAPVNPQFWPEALTSLYSLVNNIRSEVVQTWQRPAGYQSFIDNLPAVLGLLLPASCCWRAVASGRCGCCASSTRKNRVRGAGFPPSSFRWGYGCCPSWASSPSCRRRRPAVCPD